MKFCLSLAFLLLLAACGNGPAHNTSSNSANEERDRPARYLQVNYQVRRNLVGRKVVEGEVINTGQFQTWKTVTLRISTEKNEEHADVNYTISESIAPGGKAAFKYKPEGNPERISVAVASATTD